MPAILKSVLGSKEFHPFGPVTQDSSYGSQLSLSFSSSSAILDEITQRDSPIAIFSQMLTRSLQGKGDRSYEGNGQNVVGFEMSCGAQPLQEEGTTTVKIGH